MPVNPAPIPATNPPTTFDIAIPDHRLTTYALFPICSIVFAAVMLYWFDVGLEPMAFIAVLLVAAACGFLLGHVTPQDERCTRVVFLSDALMVTGSNSSDPIRLPLSMIELVVERPSLTKGPNWPPSHILYGPFGHLRLDAALRKRAFLDGIGGRGPKPGEEAAELDSALRAAVPHALHIPATRDTSKWQWPVRFDHASISAHLRKEAKARTSRTIMAGSTQAAYGLGSITLTLLIAGTVGVFPLGLFLRLLPFILITLGYSAYLLSTAKRTQRWCAGCEQEVATRANAPFNCVFCGYSKAGLAADAKCPECGQAPVEPELDLRAEMPTIRIRL